LVLIAMRDLRFQTSTTQQTPSLERCSQAEADGLRLLLARRLAAALGRQAAAEAWQVATGRDPDRDNGP